MVYLHFFDIIIKGYIMAIYIIINIILILSILVVIYAFKSNDRAVRTILALISILPWVILAIFLSSYTK